MIFSTGYCQFPMAATVLLIFKALISFANFSSHHCTVCFLAVGIHLPVQEAWVQSLDWEDLLEKEMSICSSILAWEIPWTEKPGGLYSPWIIKNQTRLK